MHLLRHQPRAQNPRTTPILFGLLLFFGIVFGLALLILRRVTKHEKHYNNFNSTRLICDDSYLTTANYEDKNPPFIDFLLHEGCFTGWITLPRNWESWQSQFLQHQTNTWVMEWWDGWQDPIGSFNNDQFTTALSPTQVPSKHVRLQGNGVIRFYRTGMARNEPDTPPIAFERAAVRTEAPGQQAPDSPSNRAKPPPPLLHRQPVEGVQDKILLTIELCERVSPQSIECWGYVSNLHDESSNVSLYRADVVDGKGNSFNLSTNGQFYFSTGHSFNIPAGSSVKYTLKIPDEDQDTQTFTLYLDVSNPRDLEYTFRDVPVADQEKVPSDDGVKH